MTRWSQIVVICGIGEALHQCHVRVKPALQRAACLVQWIKVIDDRCEQYWCGRLICLNEFMHSIHSCAVIVEGWIRYEANKRYNCLGTVNLGCSTAVTRLGSSQSTMIPMPSSSSWANLPSSSPSQSKRFALRIANLKLPGLQHALITDTLSQDLFITHVSLTEAKIKDVLCPLNSFPSNINITVFMLTISQMFLS